MSASSAEGSRLRTGSLRRRVVVPVLALLLAVIITVCAVVNVILDKRLHNDARGQIRERARYAASLSSRGLTSQDLADDLTGQGITASVIDDGQVVVGRDHPPPSSFGQAGGPSGVLRDGGPPGRPKVSTSSAHVTVRESNQALRVTLVLPNGGGTVELISSLAEINRTLTLLRRVEFGVAGGTLALAALTLMVLIGTALAPLRRMRVVADRIRHGARGERLRPTKSSTDLGRTALALDEMLDSLETAESAARTAQRGMRQLLADVSHDLRTPIAGVLSTAERLLHHDPGRRAREDGLVDLIREGRRAARLVDDLLLMTRLDAGESLADRVTVPTDVHEVVSCAVEAFRRRLPDRRVDLVCELPRKPVTVGLEQDRLTRIVANLLDNAGTATMSNGTATMSNGTVRTSVRTEGEMVIVEVADNGPGVPPAHVERIFDRLFRVDPSRHAAGSGLGLPIARGLARTAGGEVRYVGPSAADGTGAIFRLELPAHSVDAADSRRTLAVLGSVN